MNHSGSAVAAGSAACAVGPSAAGDVVLEGVDQLVPDDVVQVAERPASGQHDPAAQRFGHAAGALADVPPTALVCWNCGGAGVEDQRLPARQLVVEHGRQAGVPALRHAGRDLGRGCSSGVEVDVEVLRS